MTAFVKPFQLPPAQLEEVFTSTQFKRFAVVRDPAARLLSGYLEKIRQGLQQSAQIFETLTVLGRAPKSAADISFADFIDVIGAQSSRDQDPHWRRQVDHLGLPGMRYDALIHLEELGASWGQIGALINVPDVQEEFFAETQLKQVRTWPSTTLRNFSQKCRKSTLTTTQPCTTPLSGDW